MAWVARVRIAGVSFSLLGFPRLWPSVVRPADLASPRNCAQEEMRGKKDEEEEGRGEGKKEDGEAWFQPLEE